MVTSAACLIVGGLLAQEGMDKFVPVAQKDLNSPNPADWLMLGGNMEHWNYSPLDQITSQERQTVSNWFGLVSCPPPAGGPEHRRLFTTGSCT